MLLSSQKIDCNIPENIFRPLLSKWTPVQDVFWSFEKQAIGLNGPQSPIPQRFPIKDPYKTLDNDLYLYRPSNNRKGDKMMIYLRWSITQVIILNWSFLTNNFFLPTQLGCYYTDFLRHHHNHFPLINQVRLTNWNHSSMTSTYQYSIPTFHLVALHCSYILSR